MIRQCRALPDVAFKRALLRLGVAAILPRCAMNAQQPREVS